MTTTQSPSRPGKRASIPLDVVPKLDIIYALGYDLDTIAATLNLSRGSVHRALLRQGAYAAVPPPTNRPLSVRGKSLKQVKQ
jgi:hypothetical protein